MTPLWEQVRGALSADMAATVWHRVLERIAVQRAAPRYVPVLRFAAAFVILAFVVRLAPTAFTTRTIAKTDVLLRPTHGEVSVLIGGLLQPVTTGEITLEKSALIQTGADGGATIVVHDSAVLRLGPSTTLALHDVSGTSSRAYDKTMTLYNGKLWAQLFLASRSQPMTIDTAQGVVHIREGSVSIAQGRDEEEAGTTVSVWNRSAVIDRENEDVTLFAGDQVALAQDEPAFVTKLPLERDSWTQHNLSMDVIHQREIAKLQQQRLASQAGFLPGQALYPVKRLAEQVDVLLTIGSQAKAEKILAQAETRLSEAAALLEQGSVSDATESLNEYKQAIHDVASGSGGNIAIQSLVSERIAEASAALSAALPEDGVYPVKEALLETTSTLASESADPVLEEREAKRQALSDQLALLVRKVGEAGDVYELRGLEQKLQADVEAFKEESEGIPPEFFEEARSTLIRMDSEITAMESRLGINSGTSALLSVPSTPLSDNQVDAYVERILRRMNVYTETRSRTNQLYLELVNIRGNVDNGRILRRLLTRLESSDERLFVEREMKILKGEVGGEIHPAAPLESE